MIFAAFAIPPALQRKILLHGVLGAIVLEPSLFLSVHGSFKEFSWVLYIFGAFLVYTGFKFPKGQDERKQYRRYQNFEMVTQKRITPQLEVKNSLFAVMVCYGRHHYFSSDFWLKVPTLSLQSTQFQRFCGNQ